MNIRTLSRQPHYVTNQEQLDSLIRGVAQVFLEAGLAQNTALKSFQAVLGYSLLYNRDLSCILEDIDTPPTPAHANLYGRIVVLLADELFTKLPAIMGKEFRAALRAWDTPKALRDDLAQCQRSFREITKAHAKWCGEIRDSTIAHRDPSFGKQWRLIAQLDVPRANKLAADLLEWTNSLYGVLARILSHHQRAQLGQSTA